MNAAQYILSAGVRLYQLVLSPAKTFLVGPAGGCRFTPSCSAYALEALARHGALSGTWLACKRVLRCHPWGGCGEDPVPPKRRPNRSPEFNPKQLRHAHRLGCASEHPH